MKSRHIHDWKPWPNRTGLELCPNCPAWRQTALQSVHGIRRLLQLRDCNGAVIREVDISDVEHANSQLSMSVAIMTQCSLGYWHDNSSTEVLPWGSHLRATNE